ncbi:stage II sporulation protein M [Candidatus Woesearchaeota archaeon]|nr:stage II sporulation protein M [Candidatus Woesearchaeota archaeon]
MVLEDIINPFKAEKNPRVMLLYGFLYNTVAIFLSTWIFNQYSSLVMVFLTTLVCVPLIYNTTKIEEEKDESIGEEGALLKEHWKALSFFIFMFIGIVCSCALWYSVLPASSAQNLFSIQTKTIVEINSGVTGFATQLNSFFKILFNNMKVLFFCILFAFVFGVGAIFILVWNASVIGAAIGNFIRTNLSHYSTAMGLAKAGGYFKVVSLGLFRYSLHGVPEILAYFTAGLAASIISIAMLKSSLDLDKFKHVLFDSADLLIISLALVVIAAFIEVFVTPVFF